MGAVDSTLTKPEPAHCRSTAAKENTVPIPHLAILVTLRQSDSPHTGLWSIRYPVACSEASRLAVSHSSSYESESLLLSEPVVVGVSPDLSAPTMTGVVESSIPSEPREPVTGWISDPAAFVGEGVVGSLRQQLERDQMGTSWDAQSEVCRRRLS